MNYNTKLSVLVMAAALSAAAIVTPRTNAQDVSSCASNLAACLPYLNSTSKPSPLCCIPLKKVIDNQFQCLCDLYNSAEFSGGNVTQALTLPARCGFSTDLSVCGTAQPPGTSTSPSPTGTPGTRTSPPSGAEKIVASSSVGVLLVVFFWVSTFLN